MATSVSKRCPLPKQKPARLNPARRKAAKAKEIESDPQAVRAVCSTAQDATPQSQVGAIALSEGKAVHPRISRKTVVTKKAACRTPAQSSPSNHALSNPLRQPSAGTSSLSNPAVVTGGLLGCAAGAVILLGTGVYNRLAGTDFAILTARTSKAVIDNIVEETVVSLKSGTYNPPEAIDMLRRTSLAYASSIPGGAAFVETLFREIDAVRTQRGAELDQALTEACDELVTARRRGVTSIEMHTLVLRQLVKLSAFTSHAAQDIMARNPAWRTYMPAVEKQKMPTVRINMIVREKNVPAKCPASRAR